MPKNNIFAEKDLSLFEQGEHTHIYRLLGAHVEETDGVSGCRFAVWAPNAIRVSVVGDFNFWDGRRLPMHRHEKYGIFELFVPGVKQGDICSIKVEGGECRRGDKLYKEVRRA